MNAIVQFIKNALHFVKNLVRHIVHGILNFAEHVVSWFKKIQNLNKEKDVPFIADANSPEFKNMIANAPVKNVGIFEGVYDESTDEISHIRDVRADGLDTTTKQILGREPLVVLN